jgi:threonine/homoserine/homoserine lactone efflux protein
MDLFTKPWSDSGCIDLGPNGEEIATLQCIWPLFNNLINAALVLSSIVALFYIIWAGIRIITAQGDAEQISAGKKTLTFAIIGFVFIMLSFVVFNLVFGALGIEQNYVGPGEENRIEVTPFPDGE